MYKNKNKKEILVMKMSMKMFYNEKNQKKKKKKSNTWKIKQHRDQFLKKSKNFRLSITFSI